VPVLVDDVDGERFALTESAAILVYLAERSPSPRHASPMRPNASSVFSMRSLADQAFAAGDDFTIADIAHFGWLWRRQFPGRTLDERPNLTRWYDDVAARPAVQLAIAGGEALVPGA
jgi:glutathione S-transferase